jgi:hypothetical protein
MSLEEMYYYAFYKIYSFMDFFKSKDISNKFRAIILMTFLEAWSLFAIYNYLDIVLKRHTTIQLISFKSVPFIAILLIKWFAFIKDDRWRGYMKKFDSFSKEKNRNGTYVIVGIVLFIFGNLILSGYL